MSMNRNLDNSKLYVHCNSRRPVAEHNNVYRVDISYICMLSELYIAIMLAIAPITKPTCIGSVLYKFLCYVQGACRMCVI